MLKTLIIISILLSSLLAEDCNQFRDNETNYNNAADSLTNNNVIAIMHIRANNQLIEFVRCQQDKQYKQIMNAILSMKPNTIDTFGTGY